MMTIVSVCSDEYVPLANMTVLQNREPYCARHNYRSVMKRFQTMSSTFAGYDRMEWLYELMQNASEDDWFWCLGVDAMIMNWLIPAEKFTKGDHHFIATRDVNVECVNGDSYMVRASNEGKAMILKLISERHRWSSGAAECLALSEMVQEKPWGDYIKIVPQREINAYDYNLYGPNLGAPPGARSELIERLAREGQFQDGDFVIHWPAVPLKTRLRLAAEYMGKVIR